MRKLIFGCGYLGKRAAESWLQQGHQVFAVTRSPENAENFRQSGIEPIIADVMKPESLTGIPRVDGVLYSVGFDRKSGFSQRDLYVDGLTNVLTAIAGKTSRFLYISSTSVYGQTKGQWIDELSDTCPQSPGGQACWEAEQLVWRSFPAENTHATHTANVLRLAGIYGPGRLLRRIEEVRSSQPLAGNPNAFLNLIHVDDAVRAIHTCDRNGKSGETYLVCDDQPITRQDYYERLAVLVNAPKPSFGEATDNAPRGTGLNKRCRNRKLREELGVQLAFPTIATGLADAVSKTN